MTFVTASAKTANSYADTDWHAPYEDDVMFLPSRLERWNRSMPDTRQAVSLLGNRVMSAGSILTSRLTGFIWP